MTEIHLPIEQEPAAGDFQPGRLWSLWEIMQRFHAASFTAASGMIMRACTFVNAADIANLPEDDDGARKILRSALDDAKPSLDELPLSRVLLAQFERTRKAAETADAIRLLTMVQEFHNNLVMELTGHWFFLVKDERRELYEQSHPPFGDLVARVYPDAQKDIAGAARCFALDEWTACVFHLMRVLEHGLRTMAAEAGLTEDQTAHENWKNVIDQIESKIRDMEGQKKTSEKIARLKLFSAAAVQFRYFKDAWRNHVSHAHETYDEREASTIYGHVKTFMEQMAGASSAGTPA